MLFQSHHEEHRDPLAATIGKVGGKRVEAKMRNDDAMALNAGMLGVIPSFKDPGLAKISGRLAADETMHWTAFADAIRESLPAKALSFAA